MKEITSETRIIDLTVDQYQTLTEQAMFNAINKQDQSRPVKIFSKKEVCEKLRIAFNTLQGYINQGIIKTTANKKISETEIIKFLNLKNK